MTTKVEHEPISSFGMYRGYSEKAYNGTNRTSDYFSLPDGTRLAYDLILPTKNGTPPQSPLPVLFKYTPYLRAFTVYDKSGKSNFAELEAIRWYEEALLRFRSLVAQHGNLMDALFRTKWLGEMVKFGYAVVVVERPGTGASYGHFDQSNATMAREANEVLNWIAAQKWCNGNIGMYGDSVQAQIQFLAARTGNPHLKAIFPASTWMDMYIALMYKGGVYNKAFGSFYPWSQKLLDSGLVTPVDRDSDGALLAEARKDHHGTLTPSNLADFMKNYPFRDSTGPRGGRFWDYSALYPFIDKINEAGIPVYLTNGWYDLFTLDNFIIYDNLTVPKRMMVLSTDHSEVESPDSGLNYEAEAHRWFDYWLKGVQNGIMKEPPIHFFLMDAAKKDAWWTSEKWPPKNLETRRYYLSDADAGGNSSIKNGTLVASPQMALDAYDAYNVDYSTTTGKKSRWTAVTWSHRYPDMSHNDAKGLTYTGPPLEAAVQVVGSPITHLWLSADVSDLDVFTYLEEIDVKGSSKYITEGNLRMSHRALGKATYDNLGLPYHSHLQSEVRSIPADEAVELVFDMLPTAYQFSRSKRIRVTITCADSDNFETPVLNPPPTLRLYRDANHPSYIDLPFAIIPS